MEYLAQSHARIKMLYDVIAALGGLGSRNTAVRHLYSPATIATTVVIWIKGPLLFLLLPDNIVI